MHDAKCLLRTTASYCPQEKTTFNYNASLRMLFNLTMYGLPKSATVITINKIPTPKKC